MLVFSLLYQATIVLLSSRSYFSLSSFYFKLNFNYIISTVASGIFGHVLIYTVEEVVNGCNHLIIPKFKIFLPKIIWVISRNVIIYGLDFTF